MSETRIDPVNLPSTPFDQHLKDTLSRLREQLVEVLRQVGANLRVPQSMTKQFNLDKSLVSKIARVIRESDPYAAALDVPGEEAMRIFSRSMRAAGAPAAAIESLHDAIHAFQEMIRTHCGDRTTLEMLAANSADAGTPKQRQQLGNFRKAMFRGASAVFGVQTRVHVSSHYVVPNRDDPDMLDVAIVGGLVDFRRIRSDVSWAISTMRIIPRQGAKDDLTHYQPIDPQSASMGDSPVMCDFCSTPLPQLEVHEVSKEVKKFMLPEGPVGTSHAVTLFTGWLCRKVASRWREVDDDNFEHFVTLSTPAELVIHDLFVHRDLEYARHPSVFLYNQLPGALAYPNGPQNSGLLQLPEKIQPLGSHPSRWASPDVADYDRLARFVSGRLGYAPEDFIGFRISLAFPPIPSMLLYRYDFPRRA
jgi:hypothetical protein